MKNGLDEKPDLRKLTHNFSAGPAALPHSVLLEAQSELLNWNTKGASIMEMSHRSEEFLSIANGASIDLRNLLSIPTNYKILFLQGGATQQFSQIPLNLLARKGKAGYVNTGIWSCKAIKEARRFGKINIIATSEPNQYRSIPDIKQWDIVSDLSYIHYTPNETIGGVEFSSIPDTGDIPLVADMSSTILSRPIDVSRFGLIYASAQKNIGISGITVIIIREDLLGYASNLCPSTLNYRLLSDSNSMYNTPPTFSWYMAGLIFKWLKKQGGVECMSNKNRIKKNILYDFIDASSLYLNQVDQKDRSWMNVPFLLKDTSLNFQFLSESKKSGLLNLKGHRLVGGMRASIYNAVEISSVYALINFMKEFEKRHV